MKKKNIATLLIFSSAMVISSIASSSFVFNNTAKNTFESENNIGQEPIARIVGHDELYTSIEKALDVAVSGDIVYVIPPLKANYHPTNNKEIPDKVTYEIKRNCEIKAGVTLIIPTDSISLQTVTDAKSLDNYIDSMKNDDRSRGEINYDDEGNDNPTISKPSYGKYSTENENYYLRVSVKISDDVTLTNKGNLIVSGYLSSGASAGAGIRGQTSHSYSQIILGKNAKIVQDNAQATTHCYGYIKEEDSNNGSMVDVIAGSVYLPFIVNDYRGFAFTSGIQEAVESERCTPFNQIEFRNISAKTIYRYDSKLYGVCNLYLYQDTGLLTVDEVFHQTFLILGNTSDCMLQFTDANYSLLLSHFDTSKSLMNLNFIGGAKFNKLDFNISVSGFSIKLSTKDAYFPISYRMNIELSKADEQSESAIFDTSTQMIKLLPGSSFIVNDGCELHGNEIIVYSAFIDGSNGQRDDARWSAGTTYPLKKGAILKVIGDSKIEMNKIGGNVYCDNANNIIATEKTVISKEPWNQKQDGLQYVTKDYLMLRENLSINSLETLNKKKIYIAQNAFYDPELYPNPYLSNLSIVTGGSSHNFKATQGVLHVDNIENVSIEMIENISGAKKGFLNSSQSFSLSNYKYKETIQSDEDIILGVINSSIEISNDNNGVNEFEPQSIKIRSLTPQIDGKDPLYVDKSIFLTTDIVDIDKIFDKEVTWSTSDEKIATITQEGELKGVEAGKITVYAKCGNLTASYETEVLEDEEIISIEDAWITDDSGKYSSKVIAGSKNKDDVDNSSNETFEDTFDYNYLTKSNDGTTVFKLNYLPENAAITKVEWKLTGSTKHYLLDYTGAKVNNDTIITDNGSLSVTVKWDGFTNASPDGAKLTCYVTDLEGNKIEIKMIILHDSGLDCVLEGTIVVMADNSRKRVEELKIGDEIMSFDFNSGKFIPQKIIYYKELPLDFYEGVRMHFDDDTFLEINSTQSFFDIIKKEYFEIENDGFEQFIGTQILSYNSDNSIGNKTIINLEKIVVLKRSYEIVTSFTYNFIANDVVTVEPTVFDTNLFPINDEFKYDKAAIMNDVQKFGLYTYDELKMIMTENQFKYYNAAFFKIPISKGVIKFEDIVKAIRKYWEYSIK